MNGRATIIRADARALPLADASVDLVVTSPPYFALRSYQDAGEHYDGQLGSEATPDAYLDGLIACTREMMRVLKPAGSIWLNLGDKYANSQGVQGSTGERCDRAQASTYERRHGVAGFRPKTLLGIPWRYALRCIDELGLILRAEVIWSKPNGLPESVTDRVRRSHETWFHFTLQPRYYSAVDEIRDEHRSDARKWDSGVSATNRGKSRSVWQGGDGSRFSGGQNPLGKLPGSVWEIATQPLTVPAELGVEHFAAFPVEWPRRLILGWSPEGGTVLDAFGGTGTTALAAKAFGRIGISIDMSADYCSIARWRTNDPGELAKALGVARPRTEVDGQQDLFATVGAGDMAGSA